MRMKVTGLRAGCRVLFAPANRVVHTHGIACACGPLNTTAFLWHLFTCLLGLSCLYLPGPSFCKRERFSTKNLWYDNHGPSKTNNSMQASDLSYQGASVFTRNKAYCTQYTQQRISTLPSNDRRPKRTNAILNKATNFTKNEKHSIRGR